MQTITVGSNTYTLVTLPALPGPATAEFGLFDAIAVNLSPFTGQQETQQWAGADSFDAQLTLPPMKQAEAAPWIAFLAGLQGRLNVFQAVDALAPAAPLGNVEGCVPLVDGGQPNTPATNLLGVKGLLASRARVLLPGDRLQIGYRYYMVMGDTAVNADGSGKAVVPVWPSLRETPADATAIVLAKPKGLLRLASNRRAAQWSPTRAVTLSFQCVEVR